jgi:hypothetical protein
VQGSPGEGRGREYARQEGGWELLKEGAGRGEKLRKCRERERGPPI